MTIRRLLAVVAAFTTLLLPALARSGVISTCLTTFELHTSTVPAPLVVCPQGDTDSFIDQGWWISITVITLNPDPIPVQGIHWADIWLIDSDPLNDMVLCHGSLSARADSSTNADGQTTMSLWTVAGGGCADGISVVVQGQVLTEPADCVTPRVAQIHVRSPDLDGSLGLDLVDLSMFASHFPPGSYDACCDFDLSGAVDMLDLSEFALHYGPPGHSCD